MRHRRGPERGTMWVLELEEERKEEEKKGKESQSWGTGEGRVLKKTDGESSEGDEKMKNKE